MVTDPTKQKAAGSQPQYTYGDNFLKNYVDLSNDARQTIWDAGQKTKQDYGDPELNKLGMNQSYLLKAQEMLALDPESVPLQNTVAEFQKRITRDQSLQQTQNALNTAQMQNQALQDPSSLVTQADVATINPNAAGTNIKGNVGQLQGNVSVDGVDPTQAQTYNANIKSDEVRRVTNNTEAATGEVSEQAQVDAAQGEISPEALADTNKVQQGYIQAVQAGTMDVKDAELAKAAGLDATAPAVQAAVSQGIDPMVAAQGVVKPNELPDAAQVSMNQVVQAQAAQAAGLVDEAKVQAAVAEKFTVDSGTLAEALQGNVSALGTVQGQLEGLMQSFNDGTPAWAAGAMRAATAAMASRGLGGSSMAGAAIVQAALESALPIAQADAQAFQQMELTNLNNRQQVALANAAAQQGLTITNLSNEQQAALQNSANAFALQSQNLSNQQATVLANAQFKAAIQQQNLSNRQQSNIATAARYAEMANMNLNNVQQSRLQNNANELQIDLANLSNKQQSYLAKAQLEAALQNKQIDNQQMAAMQNAARFSEAANITFTAEQQAQLHNSELMKTVGLANLNAKQATTLQNAATLAAMDMANLNNRQQAAVQNAQSFLQMDMANLSNEQQTELFKYQSRVQSLFSDQAAQNAARQFNAVSENQTEQFFANLAQQTQEFNAGMKNQREQFEAQNALIVAQANAQWRQNTQTLNTAAQNEANMLAAQSTNDFTQAQMDNIWQRERDLMDFAFRQTENAQDRATQIFLADKQIKAYEEERSEARDAAEEQAKGYLFSRFLFG